MLTSLKNFLCRPLQDKHADLIVNTYVDDLMAKLLRRLAVPLPRYDPFLDPVRLTRQMLIQASQGQHKEEDELKSEVKEEEDNDILLPNSHKTEEDAKDSVQEEHQGEQKMKEHKEDEKMREEQQEDEKRKEDELISLLKQHLPQGFEPLEWTIPDEWVKDKELHERVKSRKPIKKRKNNGQNGKDGDCPKKNKTANGHLVETDP